MFRAYNTAIWPTRILAYVLGDHRRLWLEPSSALALSNDNWESVTPIWIEPVKRPDGRNW